MFFFIQLVLNSWDNLKLAQNNIKQSISNKNIPIRIGSRQVEGGGGSAEINCKRYQTCFVTCCVLIDLFSKLRSIKESFKNIVHHRAINRGQYGLISNK